MVEIEIFTSPACRPCDVVKRRVSNVVERIKPELNEVSVKVVDVLENPESVIKYGILSTPAVAVNGKLCFVGVPSEEALQNIIKTEAKNQ